jgi:CTP:molybdopterin cytidylyltransferase MocA
MAGTTGLVLAAGAGTRAGGPQALLQMPDGTP